jgi:transcriptional regulator with XRE-family HTH domain
LKPRLFYEKQARDLLKQFREDKQLTYAQLAERLQDHGVTLETRALINKINRGKFTFAFALQVLAALDVVSLRIPNALDPDRAKPSITPGWISARDPRSRRLPSESSK